MLRELIGGLALGASVEVIAEKLGLSVGYIELLAETDAVRSAVARHRDGVSPCLGAIHG